MIFPSHPEWKPKFLPWLIRSSSASCLTSYPPCFILCCYTLAFLFFKHKKNTSASVSLNLNLLLHGAVFPHIPSWLNLTFSWFYLVLTRHVFGRSFSFFIPNPKCCSKRAISFLIYFLFFLPCLNFLQEFYYCLVFYVIAGIYCNSSVPHWNGHFRVNISFLYFTAIATVLKTAPGAKQKILNR